MVEGKFVKFEYDWQEKDKDTGVLMWIKERKGEMNFMGGIKFTRIDSEDKWTILNYAYDN